MRTKVKLKGGISLIVLVITIIVMIILAAAIILSLSNSGIIDKANKAKTDTDISNAKDLVAMAHADWMLDEAKIMAEDSSITSFGKYAEKKLKEAGYKTDKTTGSYEVNDDGEVYKYPVIPTGFVQSIYEGENTVAGGLVVYETSSLDNITKETAQTTYNQFVWVPVPDMSKFVRIDRYSNGKKQTDVTDEPAADVIVSETDAFGENTIKEVKLSTKNDLTGEYAEYASMKESVEKYGGFYIGRYETGKEGANVVVKKGVAVYNNVDWGKSMIDVGTTGAVALSRALYSSENSNVKSSLCYGVQWDAALNFISKVDEMYLKDSTGKGWYADNYNEGNPNHLTGKDVIDNGKIMNKICNIYDMAGNVFDFTMEYSNFNRVARGGCFGPTGDIYPASSCNPGVGGEYYGFRVALYLK